MKKYLLFFFSFFYFFITTPAFAQKAFNDDFSTNLNKWELVNGSWAYWQINNQALYATILQSRKLSTIVPKNEFWQEMAEYEVDFIFKVFGYTTFVARLFSAILGILSIYGINILGKELINKKVGLISALILTINPFHLYFSQEARPYILLFLFSIFL